MGVPSEIAKGIDDALRALDDPAFSALSPSISMKEAALLAKGKVRTAQETADLLANLSARGTEGALPTEVLHLARQWDAIHRMLGPGRTLLAELSAAFPPLGKIVDESARLYMEVSAGPATAYRLRRQRGEFTKLVKWFDDVSALVKLEIGEAAPLVRQAYGSSTSGDPVKAYLAALADFRKLLEHQRDVLGAMAKEGASSAVSAARRGLTVTRIATGGGGPGEPAVGYAYKALKDWARTIGKDPADLARALAARVGEALKETSAKDLVKLVSDDSLAYARALGIVANLKAKGDARWREILNAVKTKDLEALKGHLNQFRGLLPEEAADTIGALSSIGQKKALEFMADLPPDLVESMGKMSVEHLKGPFWVKGKGGLWEEFGDGATLLFDADGKTAYLLLLGESKTYIPFWLFEQLFETGDKRLGQLLTYVDGNNKLRTILLKPPPGNHRPVYVFSTPRVLDPVQAVRREKLIERMKKFWGPGEREVYKLDLPFARDQNEIFSWTLFDESVRLLESL